MRWSSDHPDYAGVGTVDPLTAQGLRLLPESAVLFTAVSV
jgi:hypothetical protein